MPWSGTRRVRGIDGERGRRDVRRREQPLGQGLVECERERDRAGPGVGHPEQLQHTRDPVLPRAPPSIAFAQVEDHVGPPAFDPLNEGEYAIADRKRVDVMAERVERCPDARHAVEHRIDVGATLVVGDVVDQRDGESVRPGLDVPPRYMNFRYINIPSPGL